MSADTAYHHGEASLQSTIIGLAHNFVGSNNINLLVPAGYGLASPACPLPAPCDPRSVGVQVLTAHAQSNCA